MGNEREQAGVNAAAGETTSGRAAGAGARGWFRDLTREHRLELLVVIVLSVAALASAWCGYQASQWNGEQSRSFFRASGIRAQATQLRNTAYLQAIADTGTLRDWETAYIANDEAAMAFYWSRFTPELATAAEAWLALDPLNNPDAPRSPLLMPGYRQSTLDEATALDAEADRLATKGEEANGRAGRYVFNTVIFATVLLFAGLATKVSSLPARKLTIALSLVFFTIGIVRLIMLPTSF